MPHLYPSNITMEDAVAAGDGTLHGAIDYWQYRALQAEKIRKELPPLPKAHTIVNPTNAEPYDLFTARQMVEYYLNGRDLPLETPVGY